MKKLFLTFLLLFLSTPAFASNVISVQIDGMTCRACVMTIEKQFGKLESVASVNADLDTQIITLAKKDSQNISDAKIKELIEWGGYDLIKIERP
jgi:copper chaperone CopZ